MKTATKLLSASVLSTSLLLGSFLVVQAASFNQIAYNVEVSSANAEAGDLISYKSGKYQLSSEEYDTGIYGVISKDPDVSLNTITASTKPVVVSGQVSVKVSDKNGTIKAGDLITSSKDIGIGQRATRSGHVLGKALEDFPDSGKGGVASISVLLNISYNQVSATAENLTNAGVDQVAKKVSSSFITGNIPNLLKYIFALLLGTISFLVGLSHFVRSNRTAVESIARNPLAKGDIQRQLIFGTAGILVVCGFGLIIAVWILIFL